MAKKNRGTLKRYFREGALPSEDQFCDLIDSSLNTIDEGFDKTPENGFEISLIGNHDQLISFFGTTASKDAVWSINYDKEHDRLLIKKPNGKAGSPPAMTFAADGKVGVNKSDPTHALDVDGVVASHGRLGANTSSQITVPANGEWHNIVGPLSGCQAFEVMAGVGSKGTGKYSLIQATAINTFNPQGWLFNFLNLKKRIKYTQAYYLSRITRIKLRWSGNEEEYYLQMRTNSDYGDKVKIRYYITRLWFDADMRESWAQEDDQANDGKSNE